MDNAAQLIKNSNEIAIFGGKNSRGDIFGAISVLTDFLNNIGKKSHAIILNNDFKTPDFFSLKDSVSHSLQSVLPYIISIDKNTAEISEIAFNASENAYLLEIYLQKGAISSANVRISQKEFKPDLIITLGVSDRSELIEFAPEYSQVFFDTPIINIDNMVENTKYGQVNLVYLTKSSRCEIIFELLRTLDELSMSPAHTTSLLGGIIMETKNLISPKTNPSTFETVARLIERGADYKSIIEKLYQTKSFAVLKLTGFLLSKLILINGLPLCYISISARESGAADYSLKDLPQALDEIENNFFPGFIIAAFWEKEENLTSAVVIWRDRERLINISKIIPNSVLRQNFLILNIEKNLKEALEKTIALLKKEL